MAVDAGFVSSPGDNMCNGKLRMAACGLLNHNLSKEFRSANRNRPLYFRSLNGLAKPDERGSIGHRPKLKIVGYGYHHPPPIFGS